MLLSGVPYIAIFCPSDLHLPCLVKRQSWTAELAAAIISPSLRLCKPNLTVECPDSTSFLLNSSLNVLYVICLDTQNFSPYLDLTITQKRYNSLRLAIPVILMHLSIMETAHVLHIRCSGYQNFITLPHLIRLATLEFHYHYLLCDLDVTRSTLEQLITTQKSKECQKTNSSQLNN